MKTNFINRFFGAGGLEAVGGTGGAAAGISPIAAGLAGLQGIMGIIQTIGGDTKMKKYLAQRTAYSTPEEYYKILKATQSLASQGYDAFTLNYLTNQTDRAFDQTIGTATRLGANPNDLSAMFDQKLQGIMKIGAENHQLNMENFSKYLGALDVIGQNKAAEWKSKEDILKDKMQAAGAEKQAGIQNIGSAVNAGISLSAAGQTSKLFSQQTGDLYAQIAAALAALKKTGGAGGIDTSGG